MEKMPLSAAAKKWAREKWGPNWAFAKKSGVSSEEIKRRKLEAAQHAGAYRDRTVQLDSNFIFDMPDVMILNILSNLDFLEILRMRQTSRKGRDFIDDHLTQIYADKRRQDASLPRVEFLPLGAPERERRNLEIFQDQFDRNRDVFESYVTAEIERVGEHEEWMVEAEMDYDGMGYYYSEGNLVDAVILKLRHAYPESFFERDGLNYSPIVNLTVETTLTSLERAKPCVFPDWIRNITFLVGNSDKLISFDKNEEQQAAELKPIADKLEQAVRRLLRMQKRQGRQIQIKVAIADYVWLFKTNGFRAIAERNMTVRDYRAEIERRIAAGGAEQWQDFLPEFNSYLEDFYHDEEVTDDTKISTLARIDIHGSYYGDDGMAPSPSWGGASVVRKVRL